MENLLVLVGGIYEGLLFGEKCFWSPVSAWVRVWGRDREIETETEILGMKLSCGNGFWNDFKEYRFFFSLLQYWGSNVYTLYMLGRPQLYL